jgi:hypothetical protein
MELLSRAAVAAGALVDGIDVERPHVGDDLHRRLRSRLRGDAAEREPHHTAERLALLVFVLVEIGEAIERQPRVEPEHRREPLDEPFDHRVLLGAPPQQRAQVCDLDPLEEWLPALCVARQGAALLGAHLAEVVGRAVVGIDQRALLVQAEHDDVAVVDDKADRPSAERRRDLGGQRVERGLVLVEALVEHRDPPLAVARAAQQDDQVGLAAFCRRREVATRRYRIGYRPRDRSGIDLFAGEDMETGVETAHRCGPRAQAAPRARLPKRALGATRRSQVLRDLARWRSAT